MRNEDISNDQHGFPIHGTVQKYRRKWSQHLERWRIGGCIRLRISVACSVQEIDGITSNVPTLWRDRKNKSKKFRYETERIMDSLQTNGNIRH